MDIASFGLAGVKAESILAVLISTNVTFGIGEKDGGGDGVAALEIGADTTGSLGGGWADCKAANWSAEP